MSPGILPTPLSKLVRLAAALVLAQALPATIRGQQPSVANNVFTPFVTIGGPDEDRLRLAQITGQAPSAGWLLRTPGTMTGALPTTGTHTQKTPWCTLRWAPTTPHLDVTWNSRIPVETNSGGVWAGRGETVAGGAGVRASCWRVSVQVHPEFWYTANRPYATISAYAADRSDFANPFHSGPGWSADIPVRLGNQPLLVLQPGQTSVEITVGPATAGMGTESQWWGPGIRNAILMSNHAEGIPSLYLRTSHPVDVRIGKAEARWISGVLSESPWFRRGETSELRSLGGLVVTLRTALDTGLTVGVARVVFAKLTQRRDILFHAFDPILVWGRGANVREDVTDRTDQLASAFARWVFPASGLEIYGEWARVILPASFRSLLIAPQHTQGFTVGMQWTSAFPDRSDGWRVQAEATVLEQAVESRTDLPATFYVSPSVPQGYTQRGRVIGAMIGPGSSSQFLAADHLLRTWSLGVAAGRIRWDNDAYYHAPTGTGVWAHDVSLWTELRGSHRARWAEFTGAVAFEQRLNYLFQSATVGYTEDRTFDIHNISVRLSMQPRGR